MTTAKGLNQWVCEFPESASQAGWATVKEIAQAMRLDRPEERLYMTFNVGGVTIWWSMSASGCCDFGRYGAREVA
jgi:hypothetical protein